MNDMRGINKLIETVTAAGLAALIGAWHQHRQNFAEAPRQPHLTPAGFAASAMPVGVAASAVAAGSAGGAHVLTPDILEPPAPAKKHLSVLDAPAGPEILNLRSDAQSPAPEYIQAVSEVAREDGLRKADNLAQIIAFARDDMRAHPQEPVSDEAVDADWFQRWRHEAENVGNAEVQRLWGRALATEVRQPGALHLQTLDFVRNISVEDSDVIARTLQLTIDSQIILKDDNTLRECGVTDDDLNLLEDLGVISASEASERHGLTCSLSDKEPYRSLSLTGRACLVVSADELPVEMHLAGIRLTRTGRDLLHLAVLEEPPAAYVLAVADAIKATGCYVSLAQKAVKADGSIHFINAEAL